jgi:hypothetical protein
MSRALESVNPAVVIEIDTPVDSGDTIPVAAWARNIATTWKTTPSGKKAKMTLAKAVADFKLNT